MPKQLNRLENAVANFNRDYNATRADLLEQFESDKKDDTHSPQADRVLEMLDSLDAVLDEIVTTLKAHDKKLKKPNK